jgi:GMP synthase-like glutamine amidotransferase
MKLPLFRHFLLLLLLVVCSPASANENKAPVRVAIYTHSPDTAAGPGLLTRFLTPEAGFACTVVSPQQIRDGVLADFDVVILPGGSGSVQARHLEEAGLTAIREFVRHGGGYIGICAGAYLATIHYDWSLGLINAKVIDRDNGNWARGSGRVTLDLSELGQSALGHDERQGEVFYRNGPLYGHGDHSDLPRFDTLATFATGIATNPNTREETMIGTVAIARAPFEKGRVVAISPHPESRNSHNHWVIAAIEWAAGRRD